MSVKTQVSVQFSHLVVSDSVTPWTPGFPVSHQFLELLFKPKHKNHLGSLIAQLVKNASAVLETPVGFLGWEDPLEMG